MNVIYARGGIHFLNIQSQNNLFNLRFSAHVINNKSFYIDYEAEEQKPTKV